MDKLFLVAFALVVGCLVPVQAAMNGKLMRTYGHPVTGAVISFLTGTIILLLYAFAVRASFDPSLVKTTRWYHYTGGLIGAIFVTGIIMLIPRLGAGMAFALTVSGQLLMSVIMDHFGLMGVPVNPVSPAKIAGIICLVAGVFLIRFR